MARPTGGLLRRYALALLLLTAMAVVLKVWTLPSLVDRELIQLRIQRAHAETELRRAQGDEHEAWLDAGLRDPIFRERLEQQMLHSPEVPGPIMDDGDDAGPAEGL